MVLRYSIYCIAVLSSVYKYASGGVLSLGLPNKDLVVPQKVVMSDVDSTCRLESFYLLEANSIAKRAKVPLCSPEQKFVVSAASGQIFLRDSEEAKLHNATAMHFFGTYAGPWFLYQALAGSPYETRGRDGSGIFFINDYCYYMWWMAAAQSQKPIEDAPGEYLVKIYEEITKMHDWKQRGGENFVFFFPWSIAHIAEFEKNRGSGATLQAFLGMVCQALQNSLKITVENIQSKSMCKERSSRALVVPFVPNVADQKGQALVEALSSIQHKVPDLERRSKLLHFKGRCSHSRFQNPSRRLRAHVAAALAGPDSDVDVKCIEKEPAGRVPFGQLLEEMESSIFCLVLPESGQSARLLSEIMLAGCIPVFVGPPFAAMPFNEELSYATFSVTIALEGHEWLQSPKASLKDGEPSEGSDSEVSEAMGTADEVSIGAMLADASQIAAYLRQLPTAVVQSHLLEVQRVRRKFMFFPELDHDNPGAVDSIVLYLCRHMNEVANSHPDLAQNLKRSLRATPHPQLPASTDS